MTQVDVPRTPTPIASQTPVEKLFEKNILPALDGAQVIHDHCVAKIQEFSKRTDGIIALKQRKITVYSGIIGLLQKLYFKVFGISVENGYVVRKIDLERCTPEQIEEILDNEEINQLLTDNCLAEFDKQYKRYILRIDNTRLQSRAEMKKYIDRVYRDDKKAVVKALFFMSETVGSQTTINAYKIIDDLYKNVDNLNKSVIVPRATKPIVDFNTTTLKVTQIVNYDLLNPNSLEKEASFQLVHEMNLRERTAHSKIHNLIQNN